MIYIPLGQYFGPSAWRKSLTGVLDGPATPIFWNIDKSGVRPGFARNEHRQKNLPDGAAIIVAPFCVCAAGWVPPS